MAEAAAREEAAVKAEAAERAAMEVAEEAAAEIANLKDTNVGIGGRFTRKFAHMSCRPRTVCPRVHSLPAEISSTVCVAREFTHGNRPRELARGEFARELARWQTFRPRVPP